MGNSANDTLIEEYGVPKRKKRRAGITTNKGHGESKVRRRMAKKSRRRNRQR